MRMKETLDRHPFMILIDSGITHNFLDPKVAEKAGLPIKGNGTMEEMVANGERIPSKD